MDQFRLGSVGDSVLVCCCGGELREELSVALLTFVPNLTYGLKLCVVTKTTRLRIQALRTSFLRREAGLFLRVRLRSSVLQETLRVEQLHLHFGKEPGEVV